MSVLKIGLRVEVVEDYEKNEYGYMIRKGLVGEIVDTYHYPFVLVEYAYISKVDNKEHKTHTWIPQTHLKLINN